MAYPMRKSKLEAYGDILGTLVKKPLTVDSVAYEANMDCVILRQRLDFLIKSGLIEERDSGKKTVYAITERGTAVFRVLNFQRYLEKVANTIRVVDEALRVLSTISEERDNKKKKKTKENENY